MGGLALFQSYSGKLSLGKSSNAGNLAGSRRQHPGTVGASASLKHPASRMSNLAFLYFAPGVPDVHPRAKLLIS